jgi:hypothetical protein
MNYMKKSEAGIESGGRLLEDVLPRIPITFRGSCAPAGDNRAAAPPRRVINSRRLMAFPRVEATPYHFTEKAAFASYKTAPLVSGLGYLRDLAVAEILESGHREYAGTSSRARPATAA